MSFGLAFFGKNRGHTRLTIAVAGGTMMPFSVRHGADVALAASNHDSQPSAATTAWELSGGCAFTTRWRGPSVLKKKGWKPPIAFRFRGRLRWVSRDPWTVLLTMPRHGGHATPQHITGRLWKCLQPVGSNTHRFSGLLFYELKNGWSAV